MSIIRYTTPTIRFEFSEIEVADIAVAFLIIKQGGKVVIERDISSAAITDTQDEQSLSWKLTQQETKSLSDCLMSAVIFCDWKLTDGTRGRSKICMVNVEDTGKQEVI